MKIRNPKYPFKQCGPWENCPICFEDFSLTPCTNCGNGFEDEYIEVPSKLEQLTARIAELEEENARLKEIEQTNDTLLDHLGDKNAALLDEVASQKHCYAEAVAHYEKQLAASQAYAEQLREALQTFIDEHEECTDADDWMAMLCSIEAHHVAEETLALPRDTSALDAYVAEMVKEL